MSQILEQKQPVRKSKDLKKDVIPTKVDWKDGGSPATIFFSDGGIGNGSCIRCINPPCMRYNPSELNHDFFTDFPADKNERVCPTLAISWDQSSDSPKVDSSACISCGICINRCPVHAIYFDGHTARINDSPNEYFLIDDERQVNEETLNNIVELFANLPEEGIYLSENDDIFSSIFAQLRSQIYDYNHLSRNLLKAVGINVAMRRQGDTNIRMDLILGPPGVEMGVGEVEFGADTLGTIRNILDDIAILFGRYNISKEIVVPVAVILELPNKRVEFWRLMADIQSVLNLSINTISIAALYLLVWNRSLLIIKDGNEFYLDEEATSLRPKIEELINRSVNITIGHLGLLESSK